ncbi:unnamed protein product [Acanthoscelides obtectus]|uniref:protein-histidine N-methyltransferase n=1 Tax=Acanthoscelides obtectus TaxID=200917 RepID=A0A9P0PSU2_ACAOB|nr:unnamed protein product [Acanthoscelides obtectus]CAK1644105.1 Histone-lysine N-methyltransferase setd3 [Acanthoscelides obtectus]
MVRKRRHQKIKETKTEIAENVDQLLRICATSPEKNISKALETQVEINVIAEKLRNLELNYVNKSSDPETVNNRRNAATIERFMNWVTSEGAKLESCEICEFPGYELGLKVTKDTEFSSLVLAVPRNLILTVKSASNSAFKHLIETDQLLKGIPTVALSVYLLYEKFKGNSFWKPYLDMLPDSYSTALYFTRDELEELQGSPTLENALKLNKSIARQFAYFHKLFHVSDDPASRLMRGKFTYDEYRWAVSTMMTRQNAIPSEDGDHLETALIPLWDICNHANGTISTDYNTEAQRIECFAVKDFKAGEQLFIHYGDRTNADFFVNGFVYEDNVHDGYWLKLGISKSDPLQEKRNDVLSRLTLEPTDRFFIKKGAEPIDGQLLAFLRIFNMNEEQLDHWLLTTPLDQLENSKVTIDAELDKKVWKFLQTRLKLLQGLYKTTLQEDVQILKRKDLSDNRKLAIRMRMTEKRIFEDALKYVNQRIAENGK